MPKNIVVCCDGTGGKFGSRNTNVVKLCDILRINAQEQLLFYDPGLGTFSIKPAVSKVTEVFYKVLGLAFGVGLTQNMIEAYSYIMNHFEEGDRIYLFGFSRGAYTARAIAAMIYNCGLLHPGSDNLLPYAVDLLKQKYKDANETVGEGAAVLKEFKRIYAREVPIHFLGLWDTVTSVGWVWEPQFLPNTTNNPDVRTVCHALAIDERRAFFKQNLWKFGREHEHSQSVKQVWFAGVHSDVGGGFPETESGLSQIALEWMVIEAQKKGLLVDEERARQLLCAPPLPNHLGALHNSLKAVWWVAEFFPKIASKKQDDNTYKSYIRVNLGRRRYIEPGAVIHQSAVQRRESSQSNYHPDNWPVSFDTEPWVRWECPPK